ncbi:MAG TPA: potassium ABC transporter ATPase [Burkholderiaceae bacterium]|nr:potassium ABC transporter ATPase [Burkholderiaceae bacterium]
MLDLVFIAAMLVLALATFGLVGLCARLMQSRGGNR